MKRLSILIGIVVVFLGIGLVLPALANYGRPGAMMNDARGFAAVGGLATLAGCASVFYGFRKRTV